MNKGKSVNPFAGVTSLKEGTSDSAISAMTEVSLMSQEDLSALKIIYPGMQQRELLSAFRSLRTKLIEKGGGENTVVLVSSLSAGGGASFVAMNIAASFALDEKKTAVYVDCNFDNSLANMLLNDNRDYGLMDYLENPELEPKDIIYSAGINRVRVIPPGKGGETSLEYMASERMQHLIRELKHRYTDRFVILDVPPVADSSLARILSHVADLAILVVPFGKVSSGQVLSGIDAVGEEKFAGLVFNHD